MAKSTPIRVGKDGFPGSKKPVIPKQIPGVQRSSGDPIQDTERIIKLIKDSVPKK